MRQKLWHEEASWIWASGYDDTSREGKICLFRRLFTLPDAQKDACELKVSADTRYRLFVNGTSVSIGPCKSFPGRWYYETVDIQPYLRQGPNVISAQVLRFSDKHAGSLSLMRTALPGLIVHCTVQGLTLHTDSQWQSVQDDSVQMARREDWNYGLGPPFMALHEHVDAARSPPSWRSAAGGSDPATWPAAAVVTTRSMMLPCLEPWKLARRPIPPMTEIPGRFDRVVRCSDPAIASAWTELVLHGTALDLPPQTTAWVELEVDHYATAYTVLQLVSGKGAQVKITCSECYETPMPREGPGAKRVKGDRKDHENGRLYGPVNSYTTHDGANTFEPFWFSSFRFVRLEIATSDVAAQLQSFSFRTTNYPLAVETEMTACPPDMKRLYDVGMDTLRSCMHETYEDCPFYEQNQFLMDSRLQMLFTYQVSRDDRLARKTMHEFHASRRDDGLLQAHFPSPGRMINIPLFSLFFVAMVHDHLLYFRDEALVREYLGTIDGVLEHFARLVQDGPFAGLVGRFQNPEDWAFVDWVAEWTVGPPVHGMATPPAYHHDHGHEAGAGAGGATIFSLVYAWALRLAADLADSVRRSDTANEYRARAQALCHAVNQH